VSVQLQAMALGRGSLAAHAPIAGAEAVERARAAATPLRGARIVHVSASGTGVRVPELLGALLPLAADAGLEVEWRVLFGDAELAAVTRQLHDGLQGAETAIDDAHWEAYLSGCAEAAEGLRPADLVVLHDPGTLGLALAGDGPSRTVWRCHVDASRPERSAMARVVAAVEGCAALLFPHESFAPEALRGERLRAAPPGIDPLSPRNLEPAPRLTGRVVRPLGVDLDRPFLCQAMRFDRWQDPHEAIEAFRMARAESGGLQLVLAGPLEADDAAGWRAVKEVTDYAGREPDLHVLTSYEGVGNLELGALQRLARIALVRSLRPGFGLAAAESMWKGTPVVGTPAGGLPLQVRDGVDGFLTDGPEPTAARLLELLRDPGLGIEMGVAGRERVRERFLLTHALEHELRALGDTLGAA
jgi:trehalose synthase